MLQPLISSKHVELVELPGKQIYLVGTAHISHSSANLVEEVINAVRPDSVAIELCEARYRSMKDPERWKNTDIVSVIREGRAYVLLAQLLLAGFQRKLGKQLNIKPGAEMMRALKVAEAAGTTVTLADRDVKITLRRSWAALSLCGVMKLVVAAVRSLFTEHKITEEEIELLKSGNVLDEMMKEFSAKLPGLRVPLIDERDQYLAAKIQASPGASIVAIVGAGHIPGIKHHLGKDIDSAALEIIPARRLSTRVITWGLPALILLSLVWGFLSSGTETSVNIATSWIVSTSVGAALGAAIAAAHPLAILAAFVVGPFTAVNPFMRSGWVAGLVEAVLRKPLVSDFETILDDLSSLRGIWSNRVSRILLVVIATNILSGLGALVGTYSIFSIIAR